MRLLVRGAFARTREEKTLLVGSSRKATQLREWLRRKAAIGLRTVGLICDEDVEQTEHGLPVLGRSNQFEQIVREHGISQVILLEFPLFSEINWDIIRTCDQLGVRLLIVSDLEEKMRHSVTHFEDDGFRFIGLREEPLENPLAVAIRRTAVGLSAAVLTLTATATFMPRSMPMSWSLTAWLGGASTTKYTWLAGTPASGASRRSFVTTGSAPTATRIRPS